LTDHKDD